MHIAIAGNIGSGKTTLTGLLAKHFKWEPHYEDVVDNPYLDDFYHQMERWSFNLQIYFLNSRFRQVIQIRKAERKSFKNDLWRRSYICAQPLCDGFDD
jgi:deoxyadenosine/deoxycytidine kinase